MLCSHAGCAWAQDTSSGTGAKPVDQPPPSGEVTIAPAVAATPSADSTGSGNSAPTAASVGAQLAGPEAGASPAPPTAAAVGASTVTRKAGDGADAKGPPASPFAALASPNAGPLHIQSDSLAVDYKKNSAMWKGHVHAARADGQLTSDSLKVTYGKDFHELQNMIASGNVRISRGTQWSTSNQAVLDQARQTVVLTGEPIVHDGKDQITGSKITVYLKTGESVVEGAKAVIFPRQAKTRDNGGSADNGN
jgi:lipopolysaccharide export system protein LptA